MVGAIGFEPTTPCSQSKCATRLRYAPTDRVNIMDSFLIGNREIQITLKKNRQRNFELERQLLRDDY